MSLDSLENRLIRVFGQWGMIEDGVDSDTGNSDSQMASEMSDLSHPPVSGSGKTKLLKEISELADAFVGMQAISASHSVRYLNYIMVALFELISHDNQDIRVAADEAINKITKLSDVYLTQHVICEFFIEMKRNRSKRALAVAMKKFSACIHRVNPKKRRLYAINLLPVLRNIFERDEELVWETLASSVPLIAEYIFPHASPLELSSLLLKSLLVKLESGKNYIRRAAADIIVSTVIHSRLPRELSYRLLQQLAARIFSLKQQFFLKSGPPTGGNSAAVGAGISLFEVATCLQGCLLALRNLARSLAELPPTTSHLTEETAGRSHLSSTALVRLTPPDACDRSVESGLSRDSQKKANTPVAAFHLICLPDSVRSFMEDWSEPSLETWWWTVVWMECLELSCLLYPASDEKTAVASASLVSTAALECLLTIGLPACLADGASGVLPSNFCSVLQVFFKNGPSAALPIDDLAAATPQSTVDSETLDPENLSITDLEGIGTAADPSRTAKTTAEEGEEKEHPKPVVLLRTTLLTNAAASEPPTEGERRNVKRQLTPASELSAQNSAGAGLEGETEEDHEFYPENSDTPAENSQSTPFLRLDIFEEILSGKLFPPAKWILPLFALRFDLLPAEFRALNNIQAAPPSRTSSQMLAVAYLGQLSKASSKEFLETLHLDLFVGTPFSEQSRFSPITGADLALHLMRHTDPQVRGNACILAANLLLAAALQPLAYEDTTEEANLAEKEIDQLDALLGCITDLLEKEKSGITYRMGLTALRICANPLLCSPGTIRLTARLLTALPSLLVTSARHSYRLVRREILLFIESLDWVQLEFLEHSRPKSSRLVLTSSVAGQAWCETVRLLSDPDSSIGRDAFCALLHLATTLPTAFQPHDRDPHTRLLLTRAAAWISCSSAIYGLDKKSCLVGGTGYGNLLRVAKGIPACLDVSSLALKSLPDEVPWAAFFSSFARLSRCLCLAQTSKTGDRSMVAFYRRGLFQLFQELADSLLELPLALTSPEDVSMLKSIVFGFNELLGRTPILAYHFLWFSPSSSSSSATTSPFRSSAEGGPSCLERQRRPKMALLCWHCLSLFTSSPLLTSDLQLHAELLLMVSGCIQRWGLSGLLEGSIPAGGRMELHPDHAFTRVSLVLLRHLGRLLSIFWHVFRGEKPTSPNFLTEMVQGSFLGTATTPVASAPIGQPKVTQGARSAANRSTEVPKFGFHFVQPTFGEDTEEVIIPGSKNSYGYFAHLPHFLDLYETVKASYQSYTNSSELSSASDRTFKLLSATLTALSRVLEGLRFAEIVNLVDELLYYLECCYEWDPLNSLEAAMKLLRALFGTNLSSIWDEDLAKRYTSALEIYSPAKGDRTALTELTSLDLFEKLAARHTEVMAGTRLSPSRHDSPASPTRGGGDMELALTHQPLIRCLLGCRRVHSPAMLKPSSLPTNSPSVNLSFFIRLFEPLVLRALHQYPVITSPELQSKILEFITVLIELGVNYSQLDEQSAFLKSVLEQCESLQHSNANLSHNDRTHSSELGHLISCMFQFFLVLTYERKPAGGNSEAESVEVAGDGAVTAVSAAVQETILTLAEVFHLAESLAAAGVDAETAFFPALAPIIIDVYVQRATTFRACLQNPSPATMSKAEEWMAHRESILNFMLPKFIGLPSTYDFLSVILEEAALSDRTAKSSSRQALNWCTVASKIAGHLLPALAENRVALDTEEAADGLLRLTARLLGPWPEKQLENGSVSGMLTYQDFCALLTGALAAEPSQQHTCQTLSRSLASRLVCFRLLYQHLQRSPDIGRADGSVSRNLQDALSTTGALDSKVNASSLIRNFVKLLCDSSKRLVQLLPQHIEAFISVPLLTRSIHQGSPASARSDEESAAKRTVSRMIGVGGNASEQGLASPSEVAFLARLLIALQMDFISFLRTGFFPSSFVAEVLSQDQYSLLDRRFLLLAGVDPTFAGLWWKTREQLSLVVTAPPVHIPSWAYENAMTQLNLGAVVRLQLTVQLYSAVKQSNPTLLAQTLDPIFADRTASGRASGPSPMVTLFLDVLLSLDAAQKKKILSLASASESFPQWSEGILRAIERRIYITVEPAAFLRWIDLLRALSDSVNQSPLLERIADLFLRLYSAPSTASSALMRLPAVAEIVTEAACATFEVYAKSQAAAAEEEDDISARNDLLARISQWAVSHPSPTSGSLSTLLSDAHTSTAIIPPQDIPGSLIKDVDGIPAWFDRCLRQALDCCDASPRLAAQLLLGVIKSRQTSDGNFTNEPWLDRVRSVLARRTSGRFLQQLLRAGFRASMKCFSRNGHRSDDNVPDPQATPTHVKNECRGFRPDALFSIGKILLFEQLGEMSTAVNNSTEPPALAEQFHLSGLSAALVDFLCLADALPVPPDLSAEQGTLICRFLIFLLKAEVSLLDPTSSDVTKCLLSLPTLLLKLLIAVLRSPVLSAVLFDGACPEQACLGSLEERFSLLVKFLFLLNLSAFSGLQKAPFKPPTSLADCAATLKDLLVPRLPELFHQANGCTSGNIAFFGAQHAPAATLARFTEVLNSFAANSASAFGLLGDAQTPATAAAAASAPILSRIPTCQAVNQCRLIQLDYSLALRMKSGDVHANYCCALIALARRPEIISFLRHPAPVAAPSSGPQTKSAACDLCPDLVADLERDSLAEVSTWFLSLGWLDKRMFEQTWTSYLAVLNRAAEYDEDAASLLDGESSTTGFESMMGANKEELIEQNQCRVISINALTRLLLNANLRPTPGNPLLGFPEHRPRITLSSFAHTRLGWKLAHAVSYVETHLTAWSYDQACCPQSSGSATSESYGFHWLSPNLDKSALPMLESTAQFSVEWLAKRTQRPQSLSTAAGLQSPTEPNDKPPMGFEADTLFSCLQSLRLFYHSWLRPFETLHLVQRISTNSSVSSSSNTPDSPSIAAPSTPLSPSSTTEPSGRVARKESRRFGFRQLRIKGRLGGGGGGGGGGGSGGNLSASGDGVNFAYEASIISAGHLIDSMTSLSSTSSTASLLPAASERAESEDSSLNQDHSTMSASVVSPSLPRLPAIAVLCAIVKSSVVCCDLFTTREQYLWLIGFLQAVSHRLPPPDQFEAPIYIWLTIGLARCTAVLEATLLPLSGAADATAATDPLSQHPPPPLAPQQHQSAPILLPGNLGPAVSLASAALQSTCLPPLQDAGLVAALDLLQSAVLLRNTRHPAMRQPRLLTNHPTGSPMLNDLLVKVCHYLETRIVYLFEPPPGPGIRFASAAATAAKSFPAAFSKLVGRMSRDPLVEPAGSRTPPALPPPWPADRGAGERLLDHQLQILSAAFYLVEQFAVGPASSPDQMQPAPSGLVATALARLLRSLLGLAGRLLQDCPRTFPSPARLTKIFETHLSGTTAALSWSHLVLLTWTRGMQRLLLTGRITRENCELLTKLASDRFLSARSEQISLPALNLFMSCAYVLNANSLTQARTALMALSKETLSPASRSKAIFPEELNSMLATSQEYTSYLWERLRGSGPLPRLAAPLEARVLARCLPVVSEDLIQSVTSLISVPASPAGQDTTILNGVLELALGSIVNKAVAEIARLDHVYRDLAANALSRIFHSFLATESGRKLIREWLLLSLPSLLRREPKDLALWASTVCLLSSAPNGVLRATLSLCCCPAGRSMIGSDDHVKVAGASGLTQSQLLAVTARSLAEGDSALFGSNSEERSKFVNIFQSHSVELETSAEGCASGLAALLKYFFPLY